MHSTPLMEVASTSPRPLRLPPRNGVFGAGKFCKSRAKHRYNDALTTVNPHRNMLFAKLRRKPASRIGCGLTIDRTSLAKRH